MTDVLGVVGDIIRGFHTYVIPGVRFEHIIYFEVLPFFVSLGLLLLLPLLLLVV